MAKGKDKGDKSQKLINSFFLPTTTATSASLSARTTSSSLPARKTITDPTTSTSLHPARTTIAEPLSSNDKKVSLRPGRTTTTTPSASNDEKVSPPTQTSSSSDKKVSPPARTPSFLASWDESIYITKDWADASMRDCSSWRDCSFRPQADMDDINEDELAELDLSMREVLSSLSEEGQLDKGKDNTKVAVEMFLQAIQQRMEDTTLARNVVFLQERVGDTTFTRNVGFLQEKVGEIKDKLVEVLIY